MKRLPIITALLITLACSISIDTGAPTSTPPTVTAPSTPASQETVTPTPEPTATAATTPTPPTPTTIAPPFAIPDWLINRFENPGFEVFAEIAPFPGDEHITHIMGTGWEPFYCDEPYTPDKCDAPRIGSGNDAGLMMGRPEYKPNDGGKVHSGNGAQQWFCYYHTCIAGVYQTIETTPGELCEVGAYIQSWSNTNDDPLSELDTMDDQNNSAWFILVDPTGGTFAFSDNTLPARGDMFVSPMFGYSFGIYDQYVKIEFWFVAQSDQATIFIGDQRLWPIGNNDSYIDDAFARCMSRSEYDAYNAGQGGGGIVVTEEPTATPEPVEEVATAEDDRVVLPDAPEDKPLTGWVIAGAVLAGIFVVLIATKRVEVVALGLALIFVQSWTFINVLFLKEKSIMDKIISTLILVLEKAATILVDRRAAVLGMLTALLMFAPELQLTPEQVQMIIESFGEAYGATIVIVIAVSKILTLGVGFLTLIKEWTKRSPSGLNFNSIPMFGGKA